MQNLFARLYAFSKRHPWFYPVFLGLRILFVIPGLVKHEGLGGAGRWLHYRFRYVFQNRKLHGQPAFFDQPIPVFRSRYGFSLNCLMDYVIYDEIFLDDCYGFAGIKEILRKQAGLPVIDWGTHHGMFINYIQSLGHQGEFFGAELSPVTFARARQRFEGQKNVTLLNFGIAGEARDITIGLAGVSTEQSIFSKTTGASVNVSLITPADFAAKTGLTGKKIGLLKIDIEGAEREVFDRLDCIKDLLANTAAIVIEFHKPEDVPVIHDCLIAAGFRRLDQKGSNSFYARP